MVLATNLEGDRLLSGIAVAALHLGVGYALLTGLGVTALPGTSERLKVFDIAEEPPPPVPEEETPQQRTPEPEGEAAPPALEARPSEVVMPPPRVEIERPPPVTAAPVAGSGSESSAGASPLPGPGNGAAGEGAGLGSGGQGSGIGGGGAASKPRLLSGSIVNADYPSAAYRARAEGTVIASYSVGVNGRASRCRILQSSGNPALDATTCRLIVERFRYAPARNAAGAAVPYVTGWKQDWWLGER